MPSNAPVHTVQQQAACTRVGELHIVRSASKRCMQQQVAGWESGAGGSTAGRDAQDWAAAAVGRRSTAATAGSRAVGGAAVGCPAQSSGGTVCAGTRQPQRVWRCSRWWQPSASVAVKREAVPSKYGCAAHVRHRRTFRRRLFHRKACHLRNRLCARVSLTGAVCGVRGSVRRGRRYPLLLLPAATYLVLLHHVHGAGCYMLQPLAHHLLLVPLADLSSARGSETAAGGAPCTEVNRILYGRLASGACSSKWRGGRVVQEAAQRVGTRRIGLLQQWSSIVQRQQQVAEQSVAQQ